MKRVRVYKEIISDENLRLAIQEVNAGHRRNGNHSLNKKVIEIENNMDEYVEKLRAFIQGLVDGDEHMHPPLKRRRWDRNADSGKGKWRDINEPHQPKTMFALKKVVRKECRRLQALYPPYQAA